MSGSTGGREGAGARAGCGTGCVVTLPGHLWPLSPFLSVLSGTHTSSICADVMGWQDGTPGLPHSGSCSVWEALQSCGTIISSVVQYRTWWTFYGNSLIKVNTVSHTNELYFWGFYVINSYIFLNIFLKNGVSSDDGYILQYKFTSIQWCLILRVSQENEWCYFNVSS